MVRVRVKHVAGVLREHHDRILEALQLLEKVLSSPSPDPDDVLKLVQFAQKFVDACHHGVEEYILFQGANRSGFPFTGGPIHVMVSEHGVGRYLARMMEELHLAWRGGDRNALAELVDYAEPYIEHLAQHIDKENNVLFPMLESTAAEVPATRSVEEIERENEHDKWIAVLEELKKEYGV